MCWGDMRRFVGRDDRVHKRGVLHGRCDRTGVAHRPTHSTLLGDTHVSPFHTNDAAQPRGDSNGATAVGADRNRDDASRDGRGAAARGSAGVITRVKGVPCGAVVRVISGRPDPDLMHVRDTDNNGTGAAQLLDDRVVDGVRAVVDQGHGGREETRPHRVVVPLDVDLRFDGNRNTIQRTQRAVIRIAVRRHGCLSQHVLSLDADKGVDRFLAELNPSKRLASNGHGGGYLRNVQVDKFLRFSTSTSNCCFPRTVLFELCMMFDCGWQAREERLGSEWCVYGHCRHRQRQSKAAGQEQPTRPHKQYPQHGSNQRRPEQDCHDVERVAGEDGGGCRERRGVVISCQKIRRR
eukprot:PhM_4_TR17818/c0_g1_i1/m.20696